MKKRMLALFCCLALLVALVPTALGADGALTVVLKLDSPWCVAGERVEPVDAGNSLVTPIAEGGHTLVPVGQIVKTFGGSSAWDLLTNRATFTLDGHSVVVEVGTRSAWVDGIPATMDAPARGEHNRTYVPLRFVLEKLGLSVDYQDGFIAVGRGALKVQDLPQTALLKEKLAQVKDSDALGVEEYYYSMARQNLVYQAYMEQTYALLGIVISFNPDVADSEQIKDETTGETWANWFTAQGRQNRRQVEALCADAKENGYTLSPEGADMFRSGLEELKEQVKFGGWSSLDAYLQRAYGAHVSPSVYADCLAKAALASEYQAFHESTLIYTADQLAAYASANPDQFPDGLNKTETRNVRHILIEVDTETYQSVETAPLVVEGNADIQTPDVVIERPCPPTQAALDAAKGEAERILAEFKAGEETEAAFAALANRYSADRGSNTGGGLYRYIERGDMVPEFDAWCFDASRKSGDTGVVANVAEGSRYYGYHVMYFVGPGGPKWQEVAEAKLREADMAAWLDGLLAQ